VRCCCAMLAQMNQTMVKMNTTMSLTAIDKILMMKWAIVLTLLMLSTQWRPLMVMWWCDFGDFHQSRFKTQFWWCSQSDLAKPNQLGLGQLNPIGSPILAMLPILVMTSWDLRIDISQKKMLKMP
jgi:hypothetical protein